MQPHRVYKVSISTRKVKDRLIVKCDDKTSYEDFLKKILEEYQKWHVPTIYSFKIRDVSEKNITTIGDLDTTKELHVIESNHSLSIKAHKKSLQMLKAIGCKKRMGYLKSPYCMNWVLDSHPDIHVSVEDDGMVFVTRSHENSTKIVRSDFLIINGVYYFEIHVLNKAGDANPVNIGVIKYSFRNKKDISYVGSFASWGYYSGKGKYSSYSQDTHYGQPYKTGDTIGVLINTKNRTLEYFLNGVSLGIAWNDLTFPVHPVISTKSDESSFKLNIPSKFEILKMDFLKRHHVDLYKTHDQNSIYENIDHFEYRRSKEFSKYLHTLQNETFGFIWDQLSCAIDYSVTFPAPQMCVVPSGYHEGIMICTYGSIKEGIHFFEVVVTSNTKSIKDGYISVGIISDAYNANNKYDNWMYSSDAYKIKNESKIACFGNTYSLGDKIGVYIDMFDATVEFFKNGVSQGVAFNGIGKSLRFCVKCKKDDFNLEIIPSNIDTYIVYKTTIPETVVDNTWRKNDGYIHAMEVISDNIVAKTKNDKMQDSRCLSTKKYTHGRRYFEVMAKNVKGDITLTFNREDNTYSFGHTFHLEKTYRDKEVKLGILIDFDDHKTESYLDRVKIEEINHQHSFRTLYGHVSVPPGGYGIFEIDCFAEMEVTDELCIYN